MPGTDSSSSIAITISTAHGPMHGLWWPSKLTRVAAILIPDATGSLAGPARLFDDLAARLQFVGISSLQLEQRTKDANERLVALGAVLTALTRQGVERMALIGWCSGASLAIRAGATSDAVTGVAALAPDVRSAEHIAGLAPRRLLLAHGTADSVSPVATARQLFAQAQDPKELIIIPDERHDFSLAHDETLERLTEWTRRLLRNPFKPSVPYHAPLRGIASAAADGYDARLTAAGAR